MAGERFLRGLKDDGLYTPDVKRHSIRKIELHNYYISLFSTAMKSRWPQRAYLGLYSGPGRARVVETGEIIETTAMSALRVLDPFTKYIFVDKDPRCVEALEARIAVLNGDHDVSLIEGDVRESVLEIVRAMPAYSRDRGLLSFCFVDPFSAELDFHVLRQLGTRYRMDFLILLMLGRDVRTNFRRYLEDAEDTRIANLIDDPDWRTEWEAGGYRRRDLMRFILRKFDDAMSRIGYQRRRPDEAHPIRLLEKNVFLYYLVLYSRDPLARRFWETTRTGLDPQLGLGLRGPGADTP